MVTVQRALLWPPEKLYYLTPRVNTSSQQTMQRSYNGANLEGGITGNQSRTPD